MKKTIVKFASVKFDRFDADATLPAKFSRLLNSVPLSEVVKGRTVAIKMHLGGNLGYTTVHPLFVRILIDALKNAGVFQLRLLSPISGLWRRMISLLLRKHLLMQLSVMMFCRILFLRAGN